jgi:hypothetical protein
MTEPVICVTSDNNQNQIITGSYIAGNQITVNQGWNLIGPFSTEVPVSDITTIPPDIINSPFYGYEAGYISPSILLPGKGYWIKTTSPGTIYLNTTN